MPQDQKQYWLVWLRHVWVFKTNLGVSVGVIIFELATIAIWAYMDVPLVSANNSNTLYLLSTAAQSLAAIVGLVFAIFLVFSQISIEIFHGTLTEMLKTARALTSHPYR